MLRLSPIAALLAAMTAPPGTASDGPGYHIVDRIPMTDGWWDYAIIEPVHNLLFVTRGSGVFKLDLNSGLMDQRFIPGSEGRGIVARCRAATGRSRCWRATARP